MDKEGGEVSLETLQSKDVVGLYFSALYCPPCRWFTPKLVRLYNECKEQAKSFEVSVIKQLSSFGFAQYPKVIAFDDVIVDSALPRPI